MHFAKTGKIKYFFITSVGRPFHYRVMERFAYPYRKKRGPFRSPSPSELKLRWNSFPRDRTVISPMIGSVFVPYEFPLP